VPLEISGGRERRGTATVQDAGAVAGLGRVFWLVAAGPPNANDFRKLLKLDWKAWRSLPGKMDAV
jgi:hypothetical protein